jgi:hypothetical protein
MRLATCLFIIVSFGCGVKHRVHNSGADRIEIITSGIPDDFRIRPSMATVQSSKKRILDSLLPLMQPSESIFRKAPLDTFGYSVYLNSINGKKMAIIGFRFSTLYLFEFSNNKWKPIDSCEFYDEIFKVSVTEMNDDNIDDIIVSGLPDEQKDIASYIFVSNRKGTLQYCQNRLANVTYDKKNKLVRSYFRGERKIIFRWDANTLTFIRAVERLWGPGNSRDSTAFYHHEHGSLATDLIVADTDGKIYDTALFKEPY